jgi:PadR family transcriptional regulator, regulatory protein PadR
MPVNKHQSIPRLSAIEMIILELLINNHEMFGLELVDKSSGRLKRGTVYVTLSRMEDKGYVESKLEERHENAIGLPRRIYTPTGLGQRIFAAMELYAANIRMGVLPA